MEKKTVRKKRFPAGIFILLFIIESILSCSIVSFYFYYTARKTISGTITYTRDYSLALAEAFAGMAELSYRKKQYEPLSALFREKIGQNIIDEAFFVLTDGTLICHSSKDIEKELKGNIANDEFAYNLEQILGTARKKEKSASFTDYNIMNKEIPKFPVPYGTAREHRNLIKKYLYPDINKTGWLVSRAVFRGNQAVGTVNFIISKDRIYSFLENHIRETIRLYRIGLQGSFALALFISLFVLMRYRSIQKKTIKSLGMAGQKTREERKPAAAPIMDETVSAGVSEQEPEEIILTADPIPAAGDEDYITLEFLGNIDDRETPLTAAASTGKDGKSEKGKIIVPALRAEEAVFNKHRVIRDAIPVEKR